MVVVGVGWPGWRGYGSCCGVLEVGGLAQVLRDPAILIILLIETALVTPPVGLNLFVVQNLRKPGSLNDVIVGTLPFVITLFAMLALLAFVPGLATWLPRQFG